MELFEAATTALSTASLTTTSLRPHPHSLFVAWNGVIVLAYEGFPATLTAAKQQLAYSLPSLGTENFGSKWPKTTLAAVCDQAEPLNFQELQLLRELCRVHSEVVFSLPITDTTILVSTISVVEYQHRSLEKLRRRVDIPLDIASETSGRPSAPERSRVDRVLAEWSDLKSYLPRVNAPGSRIDSYRLDSPEGCTCVTFLQPFPDQLLLQLRLFRVALDKAFPHRYVWLDEHSWHCTLRSLS